RGRADPRGADRRARANRRESRYPPDDENDRSKRRAPVAAARAARRAARALFRDAARRPAAHRAHGGRGAADGGGCTAHGRERRARGPSGRVALLTGGRGTMLVAEIGARASAISHWLPW